MKKLIAIALTTSLIASSVPVAFATGFSDIETTAWYYSDVSDVTSLGLMQGKGNGVFAPLDTMSRAEFITVVVRALYPEVENDVDGSLWYSKYVDKAIEESIITKNKFSATEITQSIKRQEVAYIVMNYIDTVGRGSYTFVKDFQFVDYDTIGNQYQDNVKMVYALGIMGGKDTKVTFDPQGIMTRAECAAVVNRMVNKDKRIAFEIFQYAPLGEIGTLYASDPYRRSAQEGDTFVKLDGTSVVLVRDEATNILGLGQGVALDLGRVSVGPTASLTLESGTKITTIYEFDDPGYGQTFGGNTYYVNPYTGEGIWECQVGGMSIYKPTTDGSWNGQLTEDSNFYWDELMEQWSAVVFNLNKVQAINPNGLK